MINVTKTYLPEKEKLDRYIQQIYDSGWLTNNGALVQQLEKKLCEFLGVENLLLVSNGTLALQIAYKTLNLSGEVITTPFSFVATTSSLIWEDLSPVFVDIDENTFNIDPEKILKKITNKTSAILPVHVFGNPCEMEKLEEISRKHKLKLIYDAAHAFNVRGEKNLFHYGDASILSFHSTKIFHTIEGGAIIFKRKEDYNKAKLLINFGIAGYEQIEGVGINCKMNEFQAAMGLSVLSEMDKIMRERENLWDRYKEKFSGFEQLQLQQINANFDQNFAYFPVVFESESKMLQIKKELNNREIFPRRYFYPSLNTLDYLKQKISCPISESIADRILCLPIYPGLSIDVHDEICKIIIQNL